MLKKVALKKRAYHRLGSKEKPSEPFHFDWVMFAFGVCFGIMFLTFLSILNP